MKFDYKDFYITKNIRFGVNSIYSLKDEVNKYLPGRIAIISDKGIEESGIVSKINDIIGGGTYKILKFTDIEGEPTFNSLKIAIDFINENNIDLVIGVGGGSGLDVAKAAASIARKSDMTIYLDGEKQVKKRDIPLILIPTTSGTGSEVTMNAIFGDEKSHVKRGLISPTFLPDLALIDPMLTKSCPPLITASSGVDAFTHAIESYISTNATFMTRMYAKAAMELFDDSITNAVFNGNNVKAREAMCYVSLLSGVSLANAGVGAVHALAYPLGGIYKVPHGIANALLLPYVFNVIGKTCINDLVDIANMLNLGDYNKRKNQVLDIVIDYLYNLLEKLALPKTLKELNIEKSSLENMALQASKIDRLLKNTPYNLNEEKIYQIYLDSYNGF